MPKRHLSPTDGIAFIWKQHIAFSRLSICVRGFMLLIAVAHQVTGQADDAVLAAEELRHAARAIEKISGIIGVEDVLDALFRDFCIGK